ncbi:unnamed protein product, partial [Rotaria sp. Silwood2]
MVNKRRRDIDDVVRIPRA